MRARKIGCQEGDVTIFQINKNYISSLHEYTGYARKFDIVWDLQDVSQISDSIIRVYKCLITRPILVQMISRFKSVRWNISTFYHLYLNGSYYFFFLVNSIFIFLMVFSDIFFFVNDIFIPLLFCENAIFRPHLSFCEWYFQVFYGIFRHLFFCEWYFHTSSFLCEWYFQTSSFFLWMVFSGVFLWYFLTISFFCEWYFQTSSFF